MEQLIASVPGLAAACGGAGGGFYFVKWLFSWIGGRMDRREAVVDAGTQQLIANLKAELDRLTARLDRVDQELIDCRNSHAEANARVCELEAKLGITPPPARPRRRRTKP